MCIPPSGTNTPCVSVWVTTVWIASAWCGARPAYNDWEPKTRCRRSSSKYEADPLAHPAEPTAADERCDRPPRPQQIERRIEVDVDEVRHLDPVETLQPVGEAAERLRIAGPLNARISSVIASRPRRMYSVEPSANTARYIGSTGRRRTKSASSEPAAANVALSTSGIVSTVGPVSSWNPAWATTPARPPGTDSRSSTVT